MLEKIIRIVENPYFFYGLFIGIYSGVRQAILIHMTATKKKKEEKE